jgi:hypothetical protein
MNLFEFIDCKDLILLFASKFPSCYRTVLWLSSITPIRATCLILRCLAANGGVLFSMRLMLLRTSVAM